MSETGTNAINSLFLCSMEGDNFDLDERRMLLAVRIFVARQRKEKGQDKAYA